MNNVSQWFSGLRGKLLAMVLSPCVVMAAMLYMSERGLKDIEEAMHEVTDVRMPSIKGLEMMNEGQTGVAYHLAAAISAPDENQRKQHIEKYLKKREQIKQGWALYEPLPQSPEEADEWKNRLVPSWQKWEAEADAVYSLITMKNWDAARLLLDGDQAKAFGASESSLGKIIKINYDIAEEEKQHSAAITAQTKRIGIIMAIIGSVLIAAFGLTVAIKLSGMILTAIRRISESGEQVKAASDQLSSASQQLSAGSTQAASSLEETVSSLEELSSMVTLNAENAKTAGTLSQSATAAAEKGGQEISQLTTAMSEISSSSKKIEDIINVIDDIAFQTNLLALNAAVEAARAGEQGKGFAVVAEAVRNLAQRSASAAKDINTLIHENNDRVSAGVKIATRSSEALKEIVESIKKVAHLNGEIATASSEQSTGIHQISQAVTQLDQATQGNASASEEVAASAEEMYAQAHTLEEQVVDLRHSVEGGAQTARHDRPAHEPGDQGHETPVHPHKAA